MLVSQGCSSCSAAMKTISMASPLNPTGIASISTHKPSRLYHRPNQLRPKILRTLIKPNPPPEPLPPLPAPPISTTTPIVVHEPTGTEELASEKGSTEEITPVVEAHEDGELQATSLSFGELFNKPVLKYGAYLLVAFLFQSIFAAWILGSSDSSPTSEVSEDTGMIVDEKRKGNVLINGNGKSYESRIVLKTSNAMNVDESVIESRIEEIRSLARQVRRAESKQLESEVGSAGIVNDDAVVSASRENIEKEIASRLNNMQNNLNTAKKSPVLSKSAPVKGVNGSGKVDDNLMFKKKTKFRSLSTEKSNPSPSPVGFSGSKGLDADTKTAIVDMNVENGWSKVEQTDGRTSVTRPSRPVSPKAMKVEDTESKNGATRKPSQASSSGPQSPRGFGNAKAESGRKSGGAASRTTDRNLKSNNLAMKKAESKQQKQNGADSWWLSLPCVYAILMRRGPDYAGPDVGFYTVENGPEEDEESFIVGFEDRVDANNFCLLLESFFEELGDFSADIVPLMRKELVEAVKVDSMKLIVARKGQLRLYAGQPLSEVESAILSLA